MTTEKAIQILKRHNKWRRGMYPKVEMVAPIAVMQREQAGPKLEQVTAACMSSCGL